MRHYLKYCTELRVWSKHFGIMAGGVASVGETEKALWVYYEIAYGPERDKNAIDHQSRFHEDRWIFARRARNFLRPFLQECKVLEQARLMSDIDPDLAGKIAGCAFEWLIRRALGRAAEGKSMGDNINEFIEKKAHVPHRRELRHVWRLRNKAVHNEGITSGEALTMVEIIEQLEGAT